MECAILVTLVLLWAVIALASGKCCPSCGRPVGDCVCNYR